MSFYALLLPGEEFLHAMAGTRAEALSQFSEHLGHEVTDQPTGQTNEYMLDEWEGSPHWISATIPVWRRR